MIMRISTYPFVWIVLLAITGSLEAQTIVESGTSRLYRFERSGKLVYSMDSMGNRLPDFSFVGYHSGERAIPQVPVKITLQPGQGDDTRRIQDALDKLGKLPSDEAGFRGALLLKRGIFRVEGTLIIAQGGIVLRGEGNGPNGTIIIAAGYDDNKYKRTLITIGPKWDHLEAHTSHRYDMDHVKLVINSRQEIINAYVPVGGNTFEVKSAAGYKPGDRIIVYRPSTQA